MPHTQKEFGSNDVYFVYEAILALTGGGAVTITNIPLPVVEQNLPLPVDIFSQTLTPITIDGRQNLEPLPTPAGSVFPNRYQKNMNGGHQLQSIMFFERLTSSLAITNLNANINTWLTNGGIEQVIGWTFTHCTIDGATPTENYICAQIYFIS